MDLGGSSETRNACIHGGLRVGALSGYHESGSFYPLSERTGICSFGLEVLSLGVWGQVGMCFEVICPAGAGPPSA